MYYKKINIQRQHSVYCMLLGHKLLVNSRGSPSIPAQHIFLLYVL
jgi:hypothetical protein